MENTFKNNLLYRNKSTRLKLIYNTDKNINRNKNTNFEYYNNKIKLSLYNNFSKLNDYKNEDNKNKNILNTQIKTIEDYIKENLELKQINNKLTNELKRFKIENQNLLNELNKFKNKLNKNKSSNNNLFYVPVPNFLKTKIKFNNQLKNLNQIKINNKLNNFSVKEKKNIILNISNSNLLTTIDNSPQKYSIESTTNSNKNLFLIRKSSTRSARNIKKHSIKLINTNLTMNNKKIFYKDKILENKLNNIKYKINFIFNGLYDKCLNNINKNINK